MGWSSSTLDEGNARYYFYFQHTNGSQIQLTAENNAVLDNPADFEDAFEAAAAILDASSDFTFTIGARMKPSNQTYSL